MNRKEVWSGNRLLSFSEGVSTESKLTDWDARQDI